jgi:invasion protein IalB
MFPQMKFSPRFQPIAQMRQIGFDRDMNPIVKLNYAIAVCVVMLGFAASIVTYQRSNTKPQIDQAPVVPVVVPAPPDVAEAPKVAVAPEKMQDWKIQCGLSAAGMEHCSAYREMVWAQDNAQTLKAEIAMRVPDGGGIAAPRMTLTAPLGAFLPSGFLLQIDAREPFIIPFQGCDAQGCFVNLDLAPDVIAAMISGQKMTVEYMTPAQEIVSFPMGLAGMDGVLRRIAE